MRFAKRSDQKLPSADHDAITVPLLTPASVIEIVNPVAATAVA
jgi:hypothetical protein